jgi:hypothetical protein
MSAAGRLPNLDEARRSVVQIDCPGLWELPPNALSAPTRQATILLAENDCRRISFSAGPRRPPTSAAVQFVQHAATASLCSSLQLGRDGGRRSGRTRLTARGISHAFDEVDGIARNFDVDDRRDRGRHTRYITLTVFNIANSRRDGEPPWRSVSEN